MIMDLDQLIGVCRDESKGANPLARLRFLPGTPCQSPAMANGRCRMHGGTSPGAPKGNTQGEQLLRTCRGKIDAAPRRPRRAMPWNDRQSPCGCVDP